MPGRVLIALAALLALCSLLYSQETRGTILGRVTDPSGAIIAGAEVRATNIATGVSANARSNEAGNYSLPYLMPGFYAIQAETSGFKRFVREGVQVRIRDTVEVNLQMQLGATSESIEVKAETPLLSTSDVSLGQTVDSRQITELPSFGGSPMDLVHLTPGMMNNTDLRVRKLSQVGANSSFTVDGSGVWTNDFTVDGVSDTMKYYSGNAYMAFVPPQSAVSEFRVQSSSFDASVGHSMGAVVNVSTKSGTNQLHGEAHWVHQNSALNAPNIFQNRSGQTIPKYHDNRYGASSGGPVYIPRVYDGRNKTFWFYAYEANPWMTPATWIGAVPTVGMRKGDLSDLLKIGPNYQLYDPFTTATAPNGRYSRQPIPNNVIAPIRLDPVAQKILNYWPLPNAAGTADGSNNWFTVENGRFNSWLNMARVDHAFSERHRFYLRASTDFYSQNQTHRFNTPWDGEYGRRRIHSVALDDVYILSPTLLVNVRYGLTQQNFEDRRTSQGFDLSTLGFSPQTVALVTDKKNATFPNVNIGSILPLSTNGWAVGDGMASSQTHSFLGSATLTRGDHTFQFGGEFRAYREFRNNNPYELSPQLTFSNTYTRGPFDNSSAPPVGGEMASFLLGIPGGQMTRTASFASQELYYALYFQDNVKLTSKLTLNLGLRYELETPLTERFNRSVSQFGFDAASPIEAQAIANYTASYPANPIAELPVSQFRVRGGLLFAGVNGNSRNLWQGSKNDFLLAHRLGLASLFENRGPRRLRNFLRHHRNGQPGPHPVRIQPADPHPSLHGQRPDLYRHSCQSVPHRLAPAAGRLRRPFDLSRAGHLGLHGSGQAPLRTALVLRNATHPAGSDPRRGHLCGQPRDAHWRLARSGLPARSVSQQVAGPRPEHHQLPDPVIPQPALRDEFHLRHDHLALVHPPPLSAVQLPHGKRPGGVYLVPLAADARRKALRARV